MENLDKSYKEFVERILEMMKFRKMNQRDLAQRLGVSAQTITDWKNNKSRSYSQGNMLSKLSDVLQSPVSYLMFGIEPKTKEESDLIPKVPWKERTDYLTDMEKKIIIAYREAERHDQAIVEMALYPYFPENKKGTTAGVG